MSAPHSARIQDHFAPPTDPRRRKVVYARINIVAIAICAVIAGADDFVSIAEYGRKKRTWVSRFLDLTAGVPSHDRLNAVLGALRPAEFQRCLLSWITALHDLTAGQVVAIDGKSLRRSFDAASSKSAIPMVGAWATANHISLGQVGVDEESNEITAIPRLLRLLEPSGCLVTIDAMGCQTEIAREVVAAGADYVLALKGNQPTLHDGIVRFFLDHLEDGFARVTVSRHETKGRGHGRQEHRAYFVCAAPEGLPDRNRWPKLAAIGVAISDTMRGGKSCDDVRYYILSKTLSGRRFGAAVRSRWSIENRLHRRLEVTFQEDQCRVREGHADTNLGILRRTALSLLRNTTTLKAGIKDKRLAAAWDDSYLEHVLFGKWVMGRSPWPGRKVERSGGLNWPTVHKSFPA